QECSIARLAGVASNVHLFDSDGVSLRHDVGHAVLHAYSYSRLDETSARWHPIAKGRASQSTVLGWLRFGVRRAFFSYIANKGDLEGIFGGNFFAWFRAAGALSFVWNLWVVIEMVRKRDPIYDKIAGTAVLREAPVGRSKRRRRRLTMKLSGSLSEAHTQ